VKAAMTHVDDSPVNGLPNYPFGIEKNSGLGCQHTPRQYPF
jgi:hypothetical protein